MKNLQEMTVKELIEYINTHFKSDGSYEYVLSFSQTGMGFRRHYKGSSKNDTRKTRVIVNPNTYRYADRYAWRVLTLEDVQKMFKKAELQQQIENLRVELRKL